MSKVPASAFALDIITGSVAGAIKEAGGSAVQATNGGVIRVDPSAVHVIEGFNVRVDTPDYLKHVEAIKASIRKEGFFNDKPLGVIVLKADDGTSSFFVKDGHTRLRAVHELIKEKVKIETIPVVVGPAGSSLEDLTVGLVQSNEGRPLSVYERAIVVKRLVGYGWDNAKIADRLSISTNYVKHLLKLLEAPAKVRDMVIAGKMSATEAVRLVKEHGAEAATVATEAAKAADETAATTGKKAKKVTAKKVEKAAKVVKEKKTGKPVEKIAAKVVSRKGLVTSKFDFAFEKGDVIETDKMKVVRFFHDADWWDFTDDTKSHVRITRDMKISVTTIQEEPDDTFADPVAAKKAEKKPNAKKGGKKPTETLALPGAEAAATPAPEDDL